MPNRDLIVIGASAGGIQALTTLVGNLPAQLPAAILVVVHIHPYAESNLPLILSRAGRLPARFGQHGARIVPGAIVVAPPDSHLLVREGYLELSRGPRENHTRPAIDPLFRTAARVYGERAIGIILSGALYDGSMGLLAIKARGGVAIVQDPEEAEVASMPRNALRAVEPDFVLPAAEIAATLTRLTRDPALERAGSGMDAAERMEAVVADDMTEQAHDQRREETAVYSCPGCGGVLWQGGDGPTLWFRCHVGHSYAPEELLYQKSDDLEAALWSSLRLLKERATLNRQLATRSRESGNPLSTERIEEQAKVNEQHAAAIEAMLRSLPAPVVNGTPRDETVPAGSARSTITARLG